MTKEPKGPTDKDDLDSLAKQVSDGIDVDWSKAESRASTPQERGLLDALRDIAQIADVHRGLSKEGDDELAHTLHKSAEAPSRDRKPPSPALPSKRASLEFAPGTLFSDRYTIVERIGGGGMGVVYKALDRELQRPVALKLLRAEAAGRAASLERFRRELDLARQVTHLNVCRVHDTGESEGLRYISMEYVDGQTLDELIQSVGSLSPRQTVTMARQVCAALRAIHECSIVHRDLKPSNIMLDRSGRAVVMDFGIAYHPGGDKITMEGEVLGTLAYLSPEQADGEKVDGRSDVYALGLILFEMLTGRRAPGDNKRIPMALREKEICPPPSQFTPEVAPALDRVVRRCLERDRDRRYESVDELDHELADIEEAGSGVLAPLPARSTAGR